MERPAELSPFGDPAFPVWLSPRGAHMCRVALEQAAAVAVARHGGASPSDEFGWLLAVLRLAEQGTVSGGGAAAGAKVRIVAAAAPAHGSVSGSAVAGVESAAAGWERKGSGRLSTRAAAQRLGVSDRAVRKACIHGRLPAVRVRGRWLIEESALEAYAQRRTARQENAHGSGGQAAP